MYVEVHDIHACTCTCRLEHDCAACAMTVLTTVQEKMPGLAWLSSIHCCITFIDHVHKVYVRPSWSNQQPPFFNTLLTVGHFTNNMYIGLGLCISTYIYMYTHTRTFLSLSHLLNIQSVKAVVPLPLNYMYIREQHSIVFT